VQKQTFGEVGTKTVILWQVVSKMFAPKIIKIYQSFFKSQSIMFGVFFSGHGVYEQYREGGYAEVKTFLLSLGLSDRPRA